MATITQQLAEHLEPAMPEGWDLFTVEANLGVLSRPAVLLSYSRSTQHFAGSVAVGKRYEIQATYVSPVTSNYEAADQDLWDAEEVFEGVLRELPFVELTASERGTYGRDSEGTSTNWAHIFTLNIGIPYA